MDEPLGAHGQEPARRDAGGSAAVPPYGGCNDPVCDHADQAGGGINGASHRNHEPWQAEQIGSPHGYATNRATALSPALGGANMFRLRQVCADGSGRMGATSRRRCQECWRAARRLVRRGRCVRPEDITIATIWKRNEIIALKPHHVEVWCRSPAACAIALQVRQAVARACVRRRNAADSIDNGRSDCMSGGTPRICKYPA